MLKNTIRVLAFILSLCILCVVAHAESTTIDFSVYDTKELTSMYGNLLKELSERLLPSSEITITADSPILFRNIPWGTSATEFANSLQVQNISGSISSWNYDVSSWEFEAKDGEIKPVDSLDDAGFNYSSYSPETSVAGFKVSEIEAGFMYTFDDNNLFKDEQKSSLISAKYTFDVIDGEASYTVLASKLSTLYGAGEEGKNSTGYWSTGGDFHVYTNWTAWYGPDDTGVVLWRVYETYDSNNTVKADNVYLMYGKTNSLKLMSALKSAMAREELKDAMQSTDMAGL